MAVGEEAANPASLPGLDQPRLLRAATNMAITIGMRQPQRIIHIWSPY